jgi:glycosyltransferase involved in cell wall biosynthesis
VKADRNHPAVSIVVATRNRAVMLERFLPSLAEQSVAEAYEIIVVDNGSTDATAEVVSRMAQRWPHIRRVVEPAPGSAHALHTGARAARAPMLLFVDDDMRAVPDLVARHLQAHREHPGACVLGHILSAPGRHPFDRMQAYIFDGPRLSLAQRPPEPSDYWSGNVSLASELYFRIGGYNQKFAEIGYGKDHEFGMRLVAAGVELVFAPEALTYHHFTESFAERLGKSRRVGFACAYVKDHFPEFPVNGAWLAPARWYTPGIVWFCRLAAAAMEPFAHGEGRPARPLAYLYDLGLRSSTQLGALAYRIGNVPSSMNDSHNR